MVHEVLSPRVQDRDKPDLRPQVFRVFRKFDQGFRNGLEQDAVENFLISEHKGIKVIGDGEDDVKIWYGKQVLFPGLDPLLFLEELALGAVPVSAGVVGDHLGPAVIALIHMAALIGGAAGFNRPHGAETVRGHGMGVAVIRTVLAEDVRNFDLSVILRVHGRYRVRRLQGLRRG